MENMPLQFGVLDLILGGLLLIFLLRGLARGIVRELGGLLSLLIAMSLTGNQGVHEWVRDFLRGVLTDPAWASLAAYVIVFVGVYFALRLVFQVLERIFSKQAPGWVDRGLGGLAGLAKGLLAGTIILVCLAYAAPESNFRNDSVLAPYFNGFWHGVSDITGGRHRLPELSGV